MSRTRTRDAYKARRLRSGDASPDCLLPQAERLGFLDELSLSDNLTLFSQLAATEACAAIARLAEQFRVSPLPPRLAALRAESGSGCRPLGVDAARRRGGRPAVVNADEPTAGLDPASAQSMVQSLRDLVAGGQAVVIVITHEPQMFLGEHSANGWGDRPDVQIIECQGSSGGDSKATATVIGRLRLEPAPEIPRAATWAHRIAKPISQLGAVAVAPLAFLWGLLGLHRPLVLAKQVFVDTSGPGTQAFSLVGCLLVAGTVAYFIFERMPKPELVEPLLLPETLLTGHAGRVVLPLGACCLVTASQRAQAALAAAERGCWRR
jgi:hypothetical protein